MKKLALVLIGILIMVFLLLYQLPMLSSEEAITSAEMHLQNPPIEWEKTISEVDFHTIPKENITISLNQKDGFWNTLTHKQQWEITVKYNGIEPTLVIDAYTGKLIDLFGPVN